MLAGWLETEPTEEDFSTAHRLLIYLCHRYDNIGERISLRTPEQVLAACQVVAGAAGGFLGLSRVSTQEKNIIAEIRNAFEMLEVEAANDLHNQGGVGWATLTGEVGLVEAAPLIVPPAPAADVSSEEEAPVVSEPPVADEPEETTAPEPPPAEEPPPEPVVEPPPQAAVRPDHETAWTVLVTLRRHRAEHAALLPGSPALALLDARIEAAAQAIDALSE